MNHKTKAQDQIEAAHKFEHKDPTPPTPSEEPFFASLKPNFLEGNVTRQQDYSLLKLVLDNIPQFVFWKNTNNTYLGCNKIFSEIVGLQTAEAIKGLTDFDLPWTRKESQFFRLCDERILEYDRPEYNIVQSHRDINGTVRWVRANKVPLHDTQGKVIGILGTGEDITDQVNAEDRMRYYEIMTSTIDDMIAIIDHNLCYLAVNDAFCTAYKQKREQIIGQTIADFTGTNIYKEQLESNINDVMAGAVTKFEGWRLFPGTGKRYIQYRYYPIRDNKGKTTSFVAQLIDITETKKLETQLYQAQKMEAIGQLTGGIAHDFNNILSVINGYSELTLMTMGPTDPNRLRIEEISAAGDRAARLTQQLLAFSKKQIIKPKPLNLASELTDIYRMLKRLLGENIDIAISTGQNLWLALMDQSQFEQVILNLTVNARDAMSESGTVNIAIHNHTNHTDFKISDYAVLAGDYVELLFSDTGHGMSIETQARIFEPFFTTKPKEAGTGLGLSTVYGIIKQNKGYISVTSETGSGTTFRLLFPRSLDYRKSEKNSFKKALYDLPGGSETVLLVEDDQTLRLMCVSILTELGYTVIEAENGREAIDSIGKYTGTIDLLLTDVVMPELGGVETADLLTKAMPELKVLFMSGFTEDSIVHRNILNEGINFLQKPITPKILSIAVRKTLEKNR